jgi:hypothetical protein
MNVCFFGSTISALGRFESATRFGIIMEMSNFLGMNVVLLSISLKNC